MTAVKSYGAGYYVHGVLLGRLNEAATFCYFIFSLISNIASVFKSSSAEISATVRRSQLHVLWHV